MYKTWKAGKTYKIQSRSGFRNYKGKALEQQLERTRFVAQVLKALAAGMLLCFLGYFKFSLLFSILAGLFTILAHVAVAVTLGGEGYGRVIIMAGYVSLGLMLSFLGVGPVLIEIFARKLE